MPIKKFIETFNKYKGKVRVIVVREGGLIKAFIFDLKEVPVFEITNFILGFLAYYETMFRIGISEYTPEYIRNNLEHIGGGFWVLKFGDKRSYSVI